VGLEPTTYGLKERGLAHAAVVAAAQAGQRNGYGASAAHSRVGLAVRFAVIYVVERCFNQLKNWRGLATRYDCEDHRAPPRPGV
jgi:hypothetical protein